ncbi:hypothetical protein HDU93_002944, partial [Gonapodya sp. JEL0774]
EEVERRRDPEYREKEREKTFVIPDEGFVCLIRNLKLMLVADRGDAYAQALGAADFRLNRTSLIAKDVGATETAQNHVNPEIQSQWSSYLALELGKEAELGSKFAATPIFPRKPPARVLREFRSARRSFQENELGACCWNLKCAAAEAGQVVWAMGTLTYCPSCRAARYCNTRCRAEHLEVHKKACESIPNLRGSDGLESEDHTGKSDFLLYVGLFILLVAIVMGGAAFYYTMA